MVRAVNFLLVSFLLFLGGLWGGELQGSALQVPEWYRLGARLSKSPAVGEAVELRVSLESLVGDLADTAVRVILPAGWRSDRLTGRLPMVRAGEQGELAFMVTATDYLTQGSIVVQADLRVPKGALTAEAQRRFGVEGAGVLQAIQRLPEVSKRYTDVSFALYPEESFYPITSSMWLNYSDKLAPREGFRGPAYYADPLVSPHQAQTDVENYEKVAAYAGVEGLAQELSGSGMNLEKKRMDYFMGLYVLATKAFEAGKQSEALDFLDLLLGKMPAQGAAYASLKIAALNLRGLTLWSQGQGRQGEEAVKKAFYVNRRHPLQRYVLRNMGLIMLSRRDDVTAEQMYRLALSYKADYTLANKEYSILSKK